MYHKKEIKTCFSFILSLYLLYSKNHIMAKNTIEHDGIVTQVADTFIINRYLSKSLFLVSFLFLVNKKIYECLLR